MCYGLCVCASTVIPYRSIPCVPFMLRPVCRTTFCAQRTPNRRHNGPRVFRDAAVDSWLGRHILRARTIVAVVTVRSVPFRRRTLYRSSDAVWEKQRSRASRHTVRTRRTSSPWKLCRTLRYRGLVTAGESRRDSIGPYNAAWSYVNARWSSSLSDRLTTKKSHRVYSDKCFIYTGVEKKNKYETIQNGLTDCVRQLMIVTRIRYNMCWPRIVFARW